MNKSITNFLYSLLAERKPQSLLIASTDPNPLLAICENTHIEFDIHCIQINEVIGIEQHRYDLGIVLLGPDNQPGIWPALARLRDVLTRYFIVIAPNTPGRLNEEVLSLGMKLIDDEEQTDFVVYEYDVASYKTTPDWLSAEGWANPNQWEKERW